MRIDVLGVGFDNVTMEEAIDRGMELLHSQGCHLDENYGAVMPYNFCLTVSNN